jgi:single stranded DNA-binding protein
MPTLNGPASADFPPSPKQAPSPARLRAAATRGRTRGASVANRAVSAVLSVVEPDQSYGLGDIHVAALLTTRPAVTASRLLGDTVHGRGLPASSRSYKNFPPTRRPLPLGNFLSACLTPPADAVAGGPEAESGTAARNDQKEPVMNETPIQLTGNLTATPELRYTNSGTAVANLRVASNPRRFDRTKGEYVDGETSYFDVEVWSGAENVAESLTKGDRVVIFGTLRTKTWQPDDGSARRSKFVVVATEVGASLRYATAKPVKSARTDTGPDTEEAPF